MPRESSWTNGNTGFCGYTSWALIALSIEAACASLDECLTSERTRKLKEEILSVATTTELIGMLQRGQIESAAFARDLEFRLPNECSAS